MKKKLNVEKKLNGLGKIVSTYSSLLNFTIRNRWRRNWVKLVFMIFVYNKEKVLTNILFMFQQFSIVWNYAEFLFFIYIALKTCFPGRHAYNVCNSHTNLIRTYSIVTIRPFINTCFCLNIIFSDIKKVHIYVFMSQISTVLKLISYCMNVSTNKIHSVES